MTSVAALIKDSTAAAHREAEAVVMATHLFEGRAAYLAYLRRLAGFYAALEPRLEATLGDVIDCPARRKRPLLVDDLAFLGDTPEAIAALPMCDVDVPLDSRATAFGVAYVLEGKTLGARFLLADARARLGLDVGAGATFFAGYGASTGVMWKSFRASLESFAETQPTPSEILEGAQATFDLFTRWISTRPS